jgi:hypothetical protein
MTVVPASPINLSVSVKATYDGVVRLPWSFGMISTCWPCQTPTHEYVVPKSIPIAEQTDMRVVFLTPQCVRRTFTARWRVLSAELMFCSVHRTNQPKSVRCPLVSLCSPLVSLAWWGGGFVFTMHCCGSCCRWGFLMCVFFGGWPNA